MHSESWIGKEISKWPDFALTNESSLSDTTYKNLVNSFLIYSGKDTLGISYKQLLMIFENTHGIYSINLGKEFIYWNLYSKNRQDKFIRIKKLINADVYETIGKFNTLKSHDWIIFEL